MEENEDLLTSPNCKVLIVDDNPQYANILKKMLQGSCGLSEISYISSCEEAFKQISAEPEKFSLLFIDFCFPSGQSGCHLLEKLSRNRLMGEKVAFLVTSEPTLDNQKEAQKYGARGVIAKPFDSHELKRQLAKAQRAILAKATEGF